MAWAYMQKTLKIPQKNYQQRPAYKINKVIGYKINTQKIVVFLYGNTGQSKKK